MKAANQGLDQKLIRLLGLFLLFPAACPETNSQTAGVSTLNTLNRV